jgi:hypothetical protein
VSGLCKICFLFPAGKRQSRAAGKDKGGCIMFDPSFGDLVVMFLMAGLYFHLGRTVGIRVGYLKGRKAVRDYYETKERVRV